MGDLNTVTFFALKESFNFWLIFVILLIVEVIIVIIIS